MPEETQRPRPHGDPLENAVHDNPEQNRASQSDATPEDIPRDTDRDVRDLSDRARGRAASANGIPEFDEDGGGQRDRQYDEGGNRERDRLAE